VSPDDQFFVGLSLHPDFVRIVESDGNFITNVAERALVQQFGMELFRPDNKGFSSVEDSVRSLIDSAGVRADKVGVVLTSKMVHIKKIPVALGLDPEMVCSQLEWEAEQFLVSPLSDYIVEYQKLPFQSREGNPLYLLVSIRRQIISNIHKMMKDSGLRLVDVDVDIFSEIRSVIKNYTMNNEMPYALIDVGTSFVHIVLVQKGEYFLSQTMPFRDNDSSSIPDSSAICGLIEKELKRLLFGHDLGQGSEDLGGIFFIGGKNAEDLVRHMESVTETSVIAVDPFQRVRLSSDLKEAEEVKKYPDRFTAPVGAVIKKFPALVKDAS